jgi:hypothetical protein
VKISHNASPLLVHFMHLNLLCFIVIVIVKGCYNQSICHGNSLRWSFGRAVFALVHFRALNSTINHFPFCLFSSIVNDLHIISPFSIISFAYEDFKTELHVICFSIQLQKFVTCSPFGLPLNFQQPILILHSITRY